MSSWAQDTIQYQNSKQSLPWNASEQVPVERVTRYEKSRQERNYDPIVGVFRDKAKESAVRTQTLKHQTQSLNAAKDKMSRFTQNFNLINHQSVMPGLESSQVVKRKATSKLEPGFNIVSNLDYATHHYSAPKQRPNKMEETAGGGGRTKFVSSKMVRDYNMISNKYLQDHEDKNRSDAHTAKQQAAQKFWKTHTYNPIAASFYSPRKEESFQEQREIQKKEHGKDNVEKLPETYKYSEGRLYNILNKEIIDKDKFSKMSTIGNRSINNKNARKVEDKIRQENQKLDDLYGTRSLNRISYTRHEEQYKLGFDVITQQPYKGRNSKPINPVRAQPKPPVWKKLDMQQSNNNKQGRDLSGIDRRPSKSWAAQKADVLVIQRGERGSTTGTQYYSVDSSQRDLKANCVAIPRSQATAIPALDLKSRDTPQVRTGGF